MSSSFHHDPEAFDQLKRSAQRRKVGLDRALSDLGRELTRLLPASKFAGTCMCDAVLESKFKIRVLALSGQTHSELLQVQEGLLPRMSKVFEHHLLKSHEMLPLSAVLDPARDGEIDRMSLISCALHPFEMARGSRSADGVVPRSSLRYSFHR